jgi:GrpB-like predicted nucleotidyltransferase (UPF0157 family)
MTEQESLEAAIREPVELVPYDPTWPSLFEAERARLSSLFPTDFIAIEHIGSTAIPGMSAKPIIDILGGVESLSGVDALSSRLCDVGYSTSAEFNAAMSDRKWFMRWAAGRRTHHLHIVVHDGELWRDRLVFRDRLRADPDAAARYERLKIDLAARYRDDREAYTAAKGAFVRSLG